MGATTTEMFVGTKIFEVFCPKPNGSSRSACTRLGGRVPYERNADFRVRSYLRSDNVTKGRGLTDPHATPTRVPYTVAM